MMKGVGKDPAGQDPVYTCQQMFLWGKPKVHNIEEGFI